MFFWIFFGLVCEFICRYGSLEFLLAPTCNAFVTYPKRVPVSLTIGKSGSVGKSGSKAVGSHSFWVIEHTRSLIGIKSHQTTLQTYKNYIFFRKNAPKRAVSLNATNLPCLQALNALDSSPSNQPTKNHQANDQPTI